MESERKQKEEEKSVITPSDTVINPRTVVIKCLENGYSLDEPYIYTVFADRTMGATR